MIQTGRIASSSYTEIFFPFAESGASVDPVCVITGATYPPAQANSGDGLKITQGLEVADIALSAGTFPTIAATESLIVLLVAALDGALPIFSLGADSANAGTQIAAGGGTFTLRDDTTVITFTGITYGTSLAAFALVLDRDDGKAYYLKDGTVVQTKDASSLTDAITLSTENKMSAGSGDFYAAGLFAFPSLPDDWQDAITWMGEKWQVGQKVIWPAWETK